jgi:signal peptidase I
VSGLRAGAAVLLVAAAAIAIALQMFGGPLTYVVVSGHSMEPALHTNDVAVVLRRTSYERGDVVAFRVPAGEAGAGGIVIHRVLGGTSRAGYLTQGDNRTGRDRWRPKPEDVIGEMAFHVPKLGLASAFLGSPAGLGLAAALLAFLGIAGGGKSAMRIAAESEGDVDVEAEPEREPPSNEVASPRPERGRPPLVATVAALSIVALAILVVPRR